ncbi:potassium channel family protein [Planktotalea sp.]|uniref:potassium channel family protein n=1 Tax=Planktotalea sp. TaxID=2029877 RepID=UPI003D6BC50B
MNAQTDTPSVTNRAYLIFYVIAPTLSHLVIAFVCLRNGPGITQYAALLYFVAGLTLVAALSGYLAYFEDRVSNLHALMSAVVNGALSIFVFAALHRTSGIMCGSQVCSGTQSVDIATLSRIAPEAVSDLMCEAKECVEIYTDLLTAFYFSTVTFTTLGYGDLQPVPAMRALAGFEAVVGYMFLGFLVGTAFHWGTNARAVKEACAHCAVEAEARELKASVAKLEETVKEKSQELAALKSEQVRSQQQAVQQQEQDQARD